MSSFISPQLYTFKWRLITNLLRILLEIGSTSHVLHWMNMPQWRMHVFFTLMLPTLVRMQLFACVVTFKNVSYAQTLLCWLMYSSSTRFLQNIRLSDICIINTWHLFCPYASSMQCAYGCPSCVQERPLNNTRTKTSIGRPARVTPALDRLPQLVQGTPLNPAKNAQHRKTKKRFQRSMSPFELKGFIHVRWREGVWRCSCERVMNAW